MRKKVCLKTHIPKGTIGKNQDKGSTLVYRTVQYSTLHNITVQCTVQCST